MTAATETLILHVVDQPADVQRAVDAAATVRSQRPDIEVRVIVNGAALTGATSDAAPLDVDDAHPVEACSVGLQRRDLDAEALQHGVITVDSAILALVDAQRAGAMYVRM